MKTQVRSLLFLSAMTLMACTGGNQNQKSETPVFSEKPVVNSINMHHGSFLYHDPLSTDHVTFFNIGEPCDLGPDGILKDRDGHPLAQFDIEDGIATGFTIIDSTCGVTQGDKPIALGYPISNVIDYDTQTTSNGKYIITKLLKHDDMHTRRDVFIEFTANDKNSPIESIRVDSTPFEVTLKGMVNDLERVSNETKAVFSMLNFDEKEPGYGAFRDAYAYCENGFILHFEEVEFEFYVYKADGKDLVVLSKKGDADKNLGATFWYYEGGSLTPVDYQIPRPDYDGDDCRYEFRHEGIEYYYHFGGDDGGYETFDYTEYHWNGERFVEETNP